MPHKRVEPVYLANILHAIHDRGWETFEVEVDEEMWPTHTPYHRICNGPFENVCLMDNKQIDTKDAEGTVNGYVLEIQSDLHGFMVPGTIPEVEVSIQQVYMTVCLPGMQKGLHLHRAKEDNFTCVDGNVMVCLYKDEEFLYIPMGYIYGFRTVKIPPTVAHGIKNMSQKDKAKVINCTYPPYSPDHSDQVEIEVDW